LQLINPKAKGNFYSRHSLKCILSTRLVVVVVVVVVVAVAAAAAAAAVAAAVAVVVVQYHQIRK
jgi:hypothetical protein